MKKRRTRSRVHPFSALIATIGIAVLGLMLFDVTGRLHGRFVDQPLQALPAASGERWGETYSARVEAVTTRLEHGPIRLPEPAMTPQQNPVQYVLREYEISLPRELSGQLRAALESARGDDPTVTFSLIETSDGLRGEVGIDGLRTHTLVVHWKGKEGSGPARVAVVIDDLGNNLLTARQVISLDMPLSLAVMPFRPFSREVAELAHLSNRDVLLHLPMEAENGEAHGERGLLLLSEDRAEVLRQLDESLAAVPYLIGVNNHMGSRFTQDRERMTWVLERLQKGSLFFLDSMTSPQSVGREVAAAVGVPFLARDVFLDNQPDQAAVLRQIQVLLDTARKRGTAIGIGHPHEGTLEALRSLQSLAEKQQVAVVPVSDLVREDG